MTPILIAQENYNLEIVSKLMNDSRVNLNIKDKKGRSFLSLSYSNEKVFSTLIHRYDIDINTVDDNGYNPLHIAAQRKDYDLISYILNSRRNSISISAKTKSGLTVMHIAAKLKSIKLMNMFSYAGLSYNVQDNDGKTPLMLLINEKSPIIKLWENMLNKRELNINLKDNQGRAIIHYAALSDKSNILPSLFRRRDLDVNLKTDKGIFLIVFIHETPMKLAVKYGNSKFVEMLLKDSRLNDESRKILIFIFLMIKKFYLFY